ncbi:MAG: TIGR01459 family HAD-type hydrolase [Albidovulum sp.]|nr:TIGR01459 family HAD-type hydrolase [Albidovulum sp.]MDE0529837.1 TIGR01459 family HAD-type hydrolase [Albidovulum sp.]
MTQLIDSLNAVIDKFDVAVLDQWGVLHRGAGAFPPAVQAVARLARKGKRTVVLTNSGKRAEVNRKRIESLGFPKGSINHVVSSGEVAWRDLTTERKLPNSQPAGALFPVCAAPRDAQDWADGDPSIVLVDKPELARHLLLMGLPDNTDEDAFDKLFDLAVGRDAGMICTNPDKVSLRGDRRFIAPGFLARKFAGLGGRVAWYGKPFSRVFDAVRDLYPDIPRERFLMIGDSMEHDIAGANRTGFMSMLVTSGVHGPAIGNAESDRVLRPGIEELARSYGTKMPDFCIRQLR